MSAIPSHNVDQSFELLGSYVDIVSADQLKSLLLKKYAVSGKDFILCDNNTKKVCYPIVKKLIPDLDDTRCIVIDHGEDGKNISTAHQIWNFLQENGADRNSRLISLGGGIVTDIGGFAASTYKRGISFIHIPSTLIGMVDASIGGKNAVNLGHVKNQVGTFSLPEGVLIHPGFLHTLHWDELLSGFAEIVKIALAFDKQFWQRIIQVQIIEAERDNLLKSLSDRWLKKVSLLKASVVEQDFKEENKRQCLNFGHTIGHALEALYLSKGLQLSHGLAVAAGIICETEIATHQGSLKLADADRIRYFIAENFPKVRFAEEEIETIIAFVRHDKKNYQGKIKMPILEAPGKCVHGITCREELFRLSLSAYNKLS